jgi:hypothetical protein
MNLLPVDRALSIYETLADRSALKGNEGAPLEAPDEDLS